VQPFSAITIGSGGESGGSPAQAASAAKLQRAAHGGALEPLEADFDQRRGACQEPAPTADPNRLPEIADLNKLIDFRRQFLGGSHEGHQGSAFAEQDP